jgi:hypothetical protein
MKFQRQKKIEKIKNLHSQNLHFQLTFCNPNQNSSLERQPLKKKRKEMLMMFLMIKKTKIPSSQSSKKKKN